MSKFSKRTLNEMVKTRDYSKFSISIILKNTRATFVSKRDKSKPLVISFV